ncbi:MAG: amino acid-binding protein [Thaumarchaeota archaeon]|nr:amino acid-binding protein [Nitrososphaerota archaeon]
MWPRIKEQFSRQVVRPDVVRKMIECGMRVSEDDKIYVGDVEVDYSAVARAVDVDRRVVKQTAQQIHRNRYLYSIFSRTRPMGASLVDLVSVLGYSALIIEADPKSPGVMAGVAEILSRHGMVVRQAIAEDPEMVPDAKMTLVIEGQLSGRALEELNALKTVKSLKILK